MSREILSAYKDERGVTSTLLSDPSSGEAPSVNFWRSSISAFIPQSGHWSCLGLPRRHQGRFPAQDQFLCRSNAELCLVIQNAHDFSLRTIIMSVRSDSRPVFSSAQHAACFACQALHVRSRKKSRHIIPHCSLQ